MKPFPSFVLAATLAVGSSLCAQVGIVGGPDPDFGAAAERERSFDLQHLVIDLTLDIPAEKFSGRVNQKLVPMRRDLREIEVDADGYTVQRCTIDGKDARFSTQDGKLMVGLDVVRNVGQAIDLMVEYAGEHPKRGLYFIHPDPDDPSKTNQAWTQGQEEDNHAWVPLYDNPNERTSWEVKLTVEETLTAVSNGVLVATTSPSAGKKTFHYKMEQPNSTYLIAFAVGPWEHYVDKLRDIPVEYFVNAGVGEATCRRSFGETPEILAFFERVTGVQYPWPKYAQVAVTDFVAGGMENVSCTLQSDSTLHDAAAHLERDSRGLVAHEAAHQWFGDLVTCRSWKDLWLNEGFATYYEALFTEEKEGVDAFRLEMRGNQESYKRSEGDKPRPMVADFYSRVDDRANHYVYVKGSSVLHMLRFILGDEAYNRSIKNYLEKHRMGLVESRDLQVAISETTGKSLEWFFEQWVYLGGYPKFEVSFDYDAENGQGSLKVKQTQKAEGIVPVFRTPVDIELVVGGKSEIHRIFISEREQSFQFKTPSRPERVRFDKGGYIIKDLKFEKSVEEWVDIALNDDDVIGRLEATMALAAHVEDPRVEKCLADVLASKDQRQVKTEAARALAKRKSSPVAQQALLAALKDSDARVRREIVPLVVDLELADQASWLTALRAIAKEDPAYGPRGNALRALGKLKDAEAFALAEAALTTKSDRGELARAGLDAMLAIDKGKAKPRVMEIAKTGVPTELKQSALRALGSLGLEGEERTAAIALLLTGLEAKTSRARSAAIEGLERIGATESIEKLEALAKESTSEFGRNRLENAIKSLREKSAKGGSEDPLKAKVEALEKRVKELESGG